MFKSVALTSGLFYLLFFQIKKFCDCPAVRCCLFIFQCFRRLCCYVGVVKAKTETDNTVDATHEIHDLPNAPRDERDDVFVVDQPVPIYPCLGVAARNVNRRGSVQRRSTPTGPAVLNLTDRIQTLETIENGSCSPILLKNLNRDPLAVKF